MNEKLSGTYDNNLDLPGESKDIENTSELPGKSEYNEIKVGDGYFEIRTRSKTYNVFESYPELGQHINSVDVYTIPTGRSYGEVVVIGIFPAHDMILSIPDRFKYIPHRPDTRFDKKLPENQIPQWNELRMRRYQTDLIPGTEYTMWDKNCPLCEIGKIFRRR